MPQITDKWLGSIPFEQSLKEQEDLKSFAQKGEFYLLGFETSRPAITKGVRANNDDIVWNEEKLKEANIEVIEIRRGGQATLHPPGQLVIYPVIHLPTVDMKIKDFIISLESITKSFLEDFNVSTQRVDEYASLGTQKGKIAFFGIHVSEGVSQHGLSINVHNDLDLFSSIKSCGVSNRPHDSLSLHGLELTTEELFYKWSERARSVWKF